MDITVRSSEFGVTCFTPNSTLRTQDLIVTLNPKLIMLVYCYFFIQGGSLTGTIPE